MYEFVLLSTDDRTSCFSCCCCGMFCTVMPVCSGGLLFLLLCIFPARASRGHRGTYDWAMRSPTDSSPWRPSFCMFIFTHLLSFPHRANSLMFSCTSGFTSLTFRTGDCGTGAHVATRTKWTFVRFPQRRLRADVTFYHPLACLEYLLNISNMQ